MRGRLSFALAALTLLFLLQGLSVLITVVFATAAAALQPTPRPVELLPLLLPLAALLAPALPLSPILERRRAIAGAAIVAAVARLPLSLPDPAVRLAAAALVVAAGAVFLSAAVGFLERRSVAGGVAAAVVLDQVFRFAGWTWDITLRPGWVLPQAVLSLAVVVMAVRWARQPAQEPDGAQAAMSSLERRLGGLRLRGGLVLALLLFLDLNVLARPDVAARWLGVPYDAAGVVLILAGTAATLLLLASRGPFGQDRPAAFGLAAMATAAALLARPLGGWPGLALLASGHAAALLLAARAVVPATGRRKGGIMAAALIVWFTLNVLYASSFLPAFAATLLAGTAPGLIAGAGAMLALLLILLPRPVAIEPPLRGTARGALPALLVAATVLLLALRPRPESPVPAASDALRVATWDLAHGLVGTGRGDPARIAAIIESAGVHVVALHGTGSLPLAFGVDAAFFTGRVLGMRVHIAPARGGLTGAAFLSIVPDAGFDTAPLPGGRTLGRLAVPLADDTIRVLAVSAGPGAADARTVMRALDEAAGAAVVVLGDIDFSAAGALARDTGFSRLPDRSGVPDVIRARGVDVSDVGVSDDVAPERSLVHATVRMR
jgi:hypothetical protein